MTPEQLEEIPGIGPKMVEKIQAAVNAYYGQFEDPRQRRARPRRPRRSRGGGCGEPPKQTPDEPSTAEIGRGGGSSRWKQIRKRQKTVSERSSGDRGTVWYDRGRGFSSQSCRRCGCGECAGKS